MNGFLVTFGHFDRFWTIFWSYLEPRRDYFGTKMGWFWGDFGPFRIIRVSFWGHLEIILGSLGPHFDHFWTILDHLGYFFGHFAVFCWCFGKLIAKLSKMRQDKAKIWKFLQKFTEMVQKLCKNKLQNTCFAQKKVKNPTFRPMKVCSKWVCLEAFWMDSECFYALL